MPPRVPPARPTTTGRSRQAGTVQALCLIIDCKLEQFPSWAAFVQQLLS